MNHVMFTSQRVVVVFVASYAVWQFTAHEAEKTVLSGGVMKVIQAEILTIPPDLPGRTGKTFSVFIDSNKVVFRVPNLLTSLQTFLCQQK